jgi:hypothetical protein
MNSRLDASGQDRDNLSRLWRFGDFGFSRDSDSFCSPTTAHKRRSLRSHSPCTFDLIDPVPEIKLVEFFQSFRKLPATLFLALAPSAGRLLIRLGVNSAFNCWRANEVLAI